MGYIMTAITFDTLRYTKRLEEAGVSRPQAEAFAQAQSEVFSEIVDNTLATKQDIVDLRRDMKEIEMRLQTHMGRIGIKCIGILGILMTILTFFGHGTGH